MATASICGSTGSITGATGALEITEWEITQTVDVQEATSFSSNGWKERIACLTGASGNFKTVGHPSTVGAHAGCTFKDRTGGYSIAGAILISKVTTGTPVDGLVSFSHDFNFTGTVTAS